MRTISSKVHSVIPDADVLLYGSRARGDAKEGSDWDILILTDKEVDRNLKEAVWEAIYPFSIEIASFISPLIVNKNLWENNPGYYVLRKTISREMIVV